LVVGVWVSEAGRLLCIVDGYTALGLRYPPLVPTVIALYVLFGFAKMVFNFQYDDRRHLLATVAKVFAPLFHNDPARFCVIVYTL